MDTFQISPMDEGGMDAIIASAGGARAHADADRRDRPGADYLLGNAVIELKALDDEGLSKPERQRKLAELFCRYQRPRPVMVLDRDRLPPEGMLEFDQLLGRPIKRAVNKASAQLKQSRRELEEATCSVLMVINNGYTAMDHEALMKLVANRARQDSNAIDGVVVGGCYFYSDGFDSCFLWPLDYLPINVDRPFQLFSKLESVWKMHADRMMTELLTGRSASVAGKGPVIDAQFEVGGITYVKPAPPMGTESPIYVHGRPRKGGAAGTPCPPVAITFPDMSATEWQKFREALPSDPMLYGSYEEWRTHRKAAVAAGTSLKPFVPIQAEKDGWDRWRQEHQLPRSGQTIRRYANERFAETLRAIVTAARELTHDAVVPARYVLARTEEIGQDSANDLTHIALVRSGSPSDYVSDLVVDARVPHWHGLMLACAYAMAEGVDCVMWQKDRRYAWV